MPLVQDCAVLGDIVAREPDSIDAALERYERQRKPDVHALGTMDHQVWVARIQSALIALFTSVMALSHSQTTQNTLQSLPFAPLLS